MSHQQQAINGFGRPPWAPLPATFSCSRRAWGVDAVRVHVTGEIDIAAAPQLESALRDARKSARLVVLDLHEADFLDTAGVHAIVDESSRALHDGGRLVVVRAPAHVSRVFALTGMREAIEIYDIDDSEVSSEGYV